MARPKQKGFEYFSFDCSFFDDIKTRRLMRRCGPDSIAVYIAILCLVFKEGYYLNVDDDLYFIISEKTGVSEDRCEEIINLFASVGFIDKGLFEQGIITSHGIQKRYVAINQQAKRVAGINEYGLIDSSEETTNEGKKKTVSSEETPLEKPNSRVSSENRQQRKEKKSKEKESKEFSSFNSSPYGSEPEEISEEEKEKILFNFFFVKNLAAPGAELESFLAYNNSGGRIWSQMSEERKHEAVKRWQQQPAREPRFKKDFLDMWRQLYATLVELDAPMPIRFDALSDSIRYEIGAKLFHLHCSRRLAEYIERDAIEKVRPFFMPFINSKNCKTIKYHVD